MLSPPTSRPDLAGQHDVGHGVDEDLGALPAVLLVPDAKAVSDLVDQYANAGVGGELLVDDDLAALIVAPAVGAGVERQLPDRVAELRGEALERGEQVCVAVAGDGLRGG